MDETGRSSRIVFGKEGLVEEKVTRSSGVPSQRLVELIALATEHNLAECWIVKQPILLLAYLLQYNPRLGLYLLEQIGPSRAKKTATSESYSLSSLVKKPKAQ